MSTFEVIAGVEGDCLVLDGTRIAGPKPWGGGPIIKRFETKKRYVPERTAHVVERHKELGDFPKYQNYCSECGMHLRAGVPTKFYRYCPKCGARLVNDGN